METPDKGTWAVDETLYRGREWKPVENRWSRVGILKCVVARQFPEGRSRALGSRAMLKNNVSSFEYHMFSTDTKELYDSDDIHFYDISEGSQEFTQVQVRRDRREKALKTADSG